MYYTDEDLTGCMAFSLAGHDKGRLYVIISRTQDLVCIADGMIKTVSSPKKKKLKHLQLVKKQRLEPDSLDDINIKRAIKKFLRDGKEAD